MIPAAAELPLKPTRTSPQMRAQRTHSHQRATRDNNSISEARRVPPESSLSPLSTERAPSAPLSRAAPPDAGTAPGFLSGRLRSWVNHLRRRTCPLRPARSPGGRPRRPRSPCPPRRDPGPDPARPVPPPPPPPLRDCAPRRRAACSPGAVPRAAAPPIRRPEPGLTFSFLFLFGMAGAGRRRGRLPPAATAPPPRPWCPLPATAAAAAAAAARGMSRPLARASPSSGSQRLRRQPRRQRRLSAPPLSPPRLSPAHPGLAPLWAPPHRPCRLAIGRDALKCPNASLPPTHPRPLGKAALTPRVPCSVPTLRTLRPGGGERPEEPSRV